MSRKSQLWKNLKRIAGNVGVAVSDLPRYNRATISNIQTLTKKYTVKLKVINRTLNYARKKGYDIDIPRASSTAIWKIRLRAMYARTAYLNKKKKIARKKEIIEELLEYDRLDLIEGSLGDINTQNFINSSLDNVFGLQDILDALINNRNLKLTEEQASMFVNFILENINTSKFDLRIVEIKDGIKIETFYTLNNNSSVLEFLKKILTKGLNSNDSLLDEIDDYGSDRHKNIVIRDIISLSIIEIDRATKIIKNRAAAFFNYVNTTNIDLSRYQIYNEVQLKQNYMDKRHKRKHCLIHTLELNNVSKGKIQSIKSMYLDGDNEYDNTIKKCIAKKDFQIIARLINRDIIIKTIREDGKERTYKYLVDKKNKELIDPVYIGLYKEHYFMYDKTDYSVNSIKHYEEVFNTEHNKKLQKIFIKNNKKYYSNYKDEKYPSCTSLKLVHMLFEKEYFKKHYLLTKQEENQTRSYGDFEYDLSNIENEQQLVNPFSYVHENLSKKKKSKGVLVRQEKKEDNVVYYCDCESFVNKKHYSHHELYLLGYCKATDNKLKKLNVCNFNSYHKKNGEYVSEEQNLVNTFLNDITNNGKEERVLVYFHNLKYDLHVFIEKGMKIKSYCRKSGNYYSVKCRYYSTEIEFRDTYKYLNFSLKKFNKKLDLPKILSKKESIAYTYYTKENNNKRVKVSKYREELYDSDKTIFDELIKNNEIKSYNKVDKTFNPTDYYLEYLELDVLVLKSGFEKFRKMVKDELEGLDVHHYLTISSLTNKYILEKGCYDFVYEMTGVLRSYCGQACYGGKCQVNTKFKNKPVCGEIQVIDENSLYPSAGVRICREFGIPVGKAMRYTKEHIKDDCWKDLDYCILTVKITKVKKHQNMPMIITKKKNGNSYYSNEVPKHNVIIDKLTLQDYIKFHDIEYEIIDGVYWDEGFNKTLGKEIEILYNKRLKYKKHPTLKCYQLIFKNMLNVIYGKNGQKRSNDRWVIVDKQRFFKDKKTGKYILKHNNNFKNYKWNNFRNIISHRKINFDQYLVKIKCVDKSYNRAHIASLFLSMSKRMMNEKLDIMNEHNMDCFYIDTDSIHLWYKDCKKLDEIYTKKYNKKLIGNYMEEMSCDFSPSDEEWDKNSKIYCDKAIYLNPKTYYEHVIYHNKKGEIKNYNHVRMKGITEAGRNHYCKITGEIYDKKLNKKVKINGDYWKLYNDLVYNEHEIILNPKGIKVSFDFKNGKVSTRDDFKRKVGGQNI